MDENLDELTFGELLKILRKRRELTQKALATKIGISRRETIAQWENGDYIPSRSHIQKLIEILRLNEEERRLLLEASARYIDTVVAKNVQEGHISPILLNIPFPRNSKFTGRKHLLHRLQQALTEKRTIALVQAISGIGGIGKTQTALEYVYRFQQNYQAVLWLNASSQETLFSDIMTLAHLLDLPGKESREQEIILAAVKHWLKEHTNWLLIFDNADDLLLVQDFIPIGVTGHILLTTRTQLVSPIAISLPIDMMNNKDGSLFLLRRCGLLETDKQFEHFSPELRMLAQEIVTELGGLPLALDQAGAYIQEMGSDLSRYLTIYREQHVSLLKQKNQISSNYRESVATIWSLSFQRVQYANSTAAELMILCAFLHPDAIPESLFVEGVEHLSPMLELLGRDRDAFGEAVKDLRRFSLLDRNAETKTLSMHRLVQIVLKDSLDRESYRQWAEQVTDLMNAVFPVVEFATWQQCEKYLSHALVCVQIAEQESIALLDAANLLRRIGQYLQQRARYQEAEPLLNRALTIFEQQHEGHYRDTVACINTLAILCHYQGKHEQAEQLYQHALEVCQKQLEPMYLDTATSLNGLAALYRDQGKHNEAGLLLERALTLREQQLGLMHLTIAESLSDLAIFYRVIGKYREAEPLLKRALTICEQQLGPTHPDTASSLNNLALFYHRDQGKHEWAEPLYVRALTIREQQLGSTHPNTAQSIHNLGVLYRDQGKYEQAEPLLARALAICEQQLGPTHPNTITSLNNLALLYRDQGRYEQAEPLFEHTLAIREQQLGSEHTRTAQSLNDLASIYYNQGKYEQARSLLERALMIREHVLEPIHLDTAHNLYWLALVCLQQQQYEQAEELLQRALVIQEQQLGPEHLDTARSLNNLALLYQDQGKYEQAEPLYRRVATIYAKMLGPNHPTTISTQKNYALLGGSKLIHL